MGAVIELHPLDDRGKEIIDQVENRTGHQPTELHPPDGTHVYILEADASGPDAFDQVLSVIDEKWRAHVSRTPETF
ncbi:MAG: hypothetical protein ACRDMH_10310 [Solirubrobacterales bacterium]